MKNILKKFNTKYVRFGGYATILSLGILIGLVILNLLTQQIPAQLDLTKRKLYSLSEQTVKILEDLNRPVTIYAIYSTGQENLQAIEILNKYRNYSKYLQIKLTDPDLKPDFIKKYDKDGRGISRGSLIIESGDRFKIISSLDLYDISVTRAGERRINGIAIEKRVTSAILYVGTGYTTKIYELTGHQEKTVFSLRLQDFFNSENYTVKSVNLLTAKGVPDDADCLLVITPDNDLTNLESEKLRTYLENKGKAVFLMDLTKNDLTNFNNIFKSYGLEMITGLVIENDIEHIIGNPYYMIPDMANHEILDPIKSSQEAILMPLPIGLRELEIKRQTIVLEKLLTSSRNSWINIDPNNDEDNKGNSTLLTRKPEDIPGPITVAAAIYEKPEGQDEDMTRILVMSSSYLLRNMPNVERLRGSIDFFMNSIAWTLGKKEIISIRSKSFFRLPLRLNFLQKIIYSSIFILVIPLLIMLVGLITWLRRRHL